MSKVLNKYGKQACARADRGLRGRDGMERGIPGPSVASIANRFGVWALRSSIGRTPPFRRVCGTPLPNAIAEERWVKLGGVDQYVLLRGSNRDAPLLVSVHGGPGLSARAIHRRHNVLFEEHFVVVYWDQRGAGKSYDRSIDPATLTIDRMSRDLTELVDALLTEFGQSQILLIAHSWGTLLSLEHLSRRPETVKAYIGVAQVTHQLNSEREGYRWALDRARALGDKKALGVLDSIGPPPWTSEQLIRQRNQIYRLRGVYAQPPSPLRSMRELLATPETGLAEVALMLDALQWSLRHTWTEFQAFDAFERHNSLDTPVHLILGRQDFTVSPRLAETWLEGLTAPRKEVIWYDSVGHMVPAEDPHAFNRDVLRIARDHDLIDLT